MDSIFDFVRTVVAFGPALYVLGRYQFSDEKFEWPSKQSLILVLLWTTIMLLVLTGWVARYRTDIFEVCKVAEAQAREKIRSDDDWDDVYEENWWVVCHPEHGPEPEPRDD